MASLISTPRAVRFGAELRFETLAEHASARLEPSADTLLRVIGGVVELRYDDGEEHLLGPQGEAIVPAGAHHTLRAVTGEARIVSGLRPTAPPRP
jgi:quercetin dioxygenase-like cupin family protein